MASLAWALKEASFPLHRQPEHMERRVSNAGDDSAAGSRGPPWRTGLGRTDKEEGFSLRNAVVYLLQEPHLLPKLGVHLHLQDLPRLRVPLHPRVCPPQGYLLQVMEQGEPHPLHPHSLQLRAPVVGVPEPRA